MGGWPARPATWTRPARRRSQRRSAAAAVTVTDVHEKPYTRRPAAPFTTSTLQQEASRKLRMSSKNAMRVAQRLYENGYITYMRTDSVTLSDAALTAARSQARDLYGAEYVPDAHAGTAPRSRMPRRPMRRCGPRATGSARPHRSPASCAVRTSPSTSSSGSARSHPR